jgi:hypothetical protein
MNIICSAIGLATAVLILTNTTAVQGQGTVTFNNPWLPSGISDFSLAYFDGISFRVNPYPPQPHDNVVLVGAASLAGHPNNGTPHVEFTDTLGIPQYMVFSWTNAASLGRSFTNGAPFGLVSVDLADPVAPSLSPVSITFNGFRSDGSIVSQTFTTPGGSATTFQTYSFGPDFANGLVRVEIPSGAWAMDNILWVPEPGVGGLVLLGLLTVGWRVARRRLAVVDQRREPRGL